jgi:GT2 family glycosyltransferase
MSDPLVTFVVVNWNGEKFLSECLDSIKSQTHRPFELIVVDNGSSDGSVALLEKDPDVHLLRNARNLGFGSANNQAVRKARGEFIAFVNNDIVLHPQWARSMLGPMLQYPEVGMCAGKTLSYSDPELIDNTGHLLYWDGVNRGRGRMQKDHGQFDNLTEAFFPSGAACLFRAQMLQQIGCFDEDFFLYGDDTELGIRARLTGWECAFVPVAIAYHRYSASTSAYDSLKFFFVERNRLWVVLKYFPPELILLSPFFSLARYFFHALALWRRKGVTGEFARHHPARNLLHVFVQAQISAWKAAPRFWRKRRDFLKQFRWSRKRFYHCFLPHRLGLKELTFTS